MRFFILCCVLIPMCILQGCTSSSVKSEEQRLALVIGIDDYKPVEDNCGKPAINHGSIENGRSCSIIKFDPLTKAVNDAAAMRDTLSDLGFEVIYLENPDKERIEKAINRFGEDLPKYTVRLFYFAGHAVQDNGVNYFIPTDLSNIYLPKDSTEQGVFEKNAVSLNQVLKKMKAADAEGKHNDAEGKHNDAKGKNIVLLDACRNNLHSQISQLPEHERKNAPRAFRGGEIISGLSRVRGGEDTLIPPSRLLIGYATLPNDFSHEPKGNKGEHAFYTKYLLEYLPKQGYSIKEVLEEVSRRVREETKDDKEPQIPWYEGAMEDVYLAGQGRTTTGRVF